MANSVVKHVILDEHRNIVVKYDIICDGSPDFVNFILFNPAEFLNKTTEKKLIRIQYALDAFSAKLNWNPSSTAPLLTLVKDRCCDCYFDGGLSNTMSVFPDPNGSICMTTYGIFLGCTGTIILYIQNKE